MGHEQRQRRCAHRVSSALASGPLSRYSLMAARCHNRPVDYNALPVELPGRPRRLREQLVAIAARSDAWMMRSRILPKIGSGLVGPLE
jgi:hypothetical protein